jgi:hypothetical protein
MLKTQSLKNFDKATIALLDADPDPSKDDWDMLKMEAATCRQGNLGY